MRAPDAAGPRNSTQVLEIGGRLGEPPSSQLVGTAFAHELEHQRGLFAGVGVADLAHTIVMEQAGVIPKAQARSLLTALLALNECPKSLKASAAKGDIYTNREAWLQAHCDASGWLGVSRARREATTVAFHIAVRAGLLQLSGALSDLAEAMSSLARKHAATIFPDYTYLQAAQPTSFGHYLLGFGFPIERHLERAAELFTRFNKSPAGGGSANGSIVPQDRAKLARLMGFDGPAENTRDAMWQADLPVEAAGLAANILITLDRLAEDLMVFTTQEFGLIRLGDRHSRASKIMPQKKNPFALSYLRGLANQAIGWQAGITAAMRTPSGQVDNRMAAYGQIPTALAQTAAAASLMEEVLDELKIDKARAREIAGGGFLAASDFAEHIMLVSDLDFRQAHRLVGALVRELEDQGKDLSQVESHDLDRIARSQLGHGLELSDDRIASALDPRKALEARTCEGGAAPDRVKQASSELKKSASSHRRAARKCADRIANAEAKLVERARKLAGPG